MANEAAKDTQATPERVRTSEVFTKHLDTVQKRDAKAEGRSNDRDRESAREDVTEPEARGAKNDDGKDADSDELQLDDLPPETQARIKKIQKSLQGDYTRKTQKLSEERKALEARLKKLEAWEPTIDRYQTLDEKRRARVRQALIEDEAAGHADGEDLTDSEVAKFLEQLEEEGRPIAKSHLDLSVKLAVKAMAKENQALKERLEKLEADADHRQRAAMDHGAKTELSEFLKHVPDYEKLPDNVRIGFERYFKAGIEDDPKLTLVQAWNEWEEINEERASRKTTETIRESRTRLEEAPVSSRSLSAQSARPKFKSQQEAFKFHARRANIRA